MEDQQLQSHSFMPLLSRVDRLDSVITYIEKKEKLSRWRRKCSSNSIGKKEKKKGRAANVAAQEAHSKGSLMDRILSLEERLVQLSQEIEASSKASSSSSIQSTTLWTNTNTTATSSSSGGAKSDLLLSSYPTYDFPINRESKSNFQFQKKAQKMLQQRLKQPGDHTSKPQQQQQNGEDGEEEKTGKSGKTKKRPITWPRLKLLGC